MSEISDNHNSGDINNTFNVGNAGNSGNLDINSTNSVSELEDNIVSEIKSAANGLTEITFNNRDEIKSKLDKSIKDAKAAKTLELNERQMEMVHEYIAKMSPKPPSLVKLTKHIFPNVPDADGRSREGIAVKRYMASLSLPVVSTQFHIPNKVELTEIQKEYISNNITNTKGPLELAKEVFQNPNLTQLHAETRVVIEFIKELPPQVTNQLEIDNIPEGFYRPPRTINTCVWKINSYCKESIDGGLDYKNLKPFQRKCVQMLIGYVNTYRFIYQINTYESESDRMLFESSFLRYALDKPDLTQEEVDQYILLCNEIVLDSRIQKRSEKLQKLLDNAAEEDENERLKITMSLNAAIENCNNEHNSCVTRQQKLLDSLKVKRSDRIQKLREQNASIINLVEMWKAEETRREILRIAEARRENIKGEVGRLTDMDSVKARIMGVDQDECLDG